DASLPKVVNAASHQGFTVQLLTADLAGGLSGALIGTDQLNDRGWIDVTFTLNAEAPVLLSQDPVARTSTFRYFFTGTATGAVTLTFIGNSVSYGVAT